MDYLELKLRIRFKRYMYSLLFIDLGKAKRSEVYHVLLTVLSFGRDSLVSFRPASEIHQPPTDKKITFILEDSAVPEGHSCY